MSPLSTARFTSLSIAPRISSPELSMTFEEQPAIVFSAGHDDQLRGHVVDKKPHPLPQRFNGRHRGRKLLLSSCQLLQLRAVDGLKQSLASRKVTIKRSWPHTRLLGNVIQAHVRPIPCEGLTSNIEDSLTIAQSIRSRLSQTSFSEVLGHGLL